METLKVACDNSSPKDAAFATLSTATLRAWRCAFLLDAKTTGTVDVLPTPATQSHKASTNRRSPASSEMRPRMVNHSRGRMQSETAVLRQQVIALEERLAMLQRGTRDAENDARAVMSLAWKTVAQSQRDERRAAENEREILRNLVKEQRRSMKRVRRVVRERMLHCLMSSTWPENHRLPGADSIVTQGFLIASNQLTSMWKELQEAQWHTDFVSRVLETYGHARLKVRDAWHLPFDVETASEAVWLCRQYRVVRLPKDVDQNHASDKTGLARRQFAMTHDTPSYKGGIHGIREIRRFRLGDYRVIAHCALIARTIESVNFQLLTCNWTIVGPAIVAGNSHIQVLEVTLPMEPNQPISIAQLAFCNEAYAFVQRVERQNQENLCLDLARRR